MPDDIDTRPLVVEMAIEPKSKADQVKLDAALADLAAEDPLFRVSTDQESGQTILKGTSEGQLEGKIDTLRRAYRIDAMSAPHKSRFSSVQPFVLRSSTSTRN